MAWLCKTPSANKKESQPPAAANVSGSPAADGRVRLHEGAAGDREHGETPRDRGAGGPDAAHRRVDRVERLLRGRAAAAE